MAAPGLDILRAFPVDTFTSAERSNLMAKFDRNVSNDRKQHRALKYPEKVLAKLQKELNL